MLKKIMLLTLAALTLMLNSPVQAKMWNLDNKEALPFILGGGIGYGGSAHSGMGYNAYLGYRFNQNIAAVGDFFITPAFKDYGHTYNYAGSIKVSLPLPNKIARHWAPFAQVGAALTHWTHNNGNHLGLEVGTGIDYTIQANLSAGAKFIYVFSVDHPKIAVATVTYHF